jgi:hypothetical protein
LDSLSVQATEDWNEAQKRLRDRLQARDNIVLDIVKKGESLSFGQWVDFFLDNYSKLPMRAEKTPRGKHTCSKTPQVCLWNKQIGGYHC